ncbi:heavy-metal-associated domain-containing protein, partial [Candidatus Sumerlaeota bacterium]|nr:heavy-metal-associated domain-containing protein [Candidatus Sumerlaeota bacterium]
PHVGHDVHVHGVIPGYVNTACALLLLVLLFNALLRPWLTTALSGRAMLPGDETATLLIGGMTCGHCARTVEQTLLACAGVKTARVDLGSKTAHITGAHFDVGALCHAIEHAGYSART